MFLFVANLQLCKTSIFNNFPSVLLFGYVVLFWMLTVDFSLVSGISLGMHRANERCCYIVTMSLIGWTHTWTDSWVCPRHSSEGIIIRKAEDTNQWNKIENCIFKFLSRSPRDQWIHPCHAEFNSGNMEIHLHFLSSFNTEMKQIVEILLCWKEPFNSLAPGKSGSCGCDLNYLKKKTLSVIRDSYDNALRWMPENLSKSTLVQVMAWCHQATSHYLGQCWPNSMSPSVVTKL